MINFDMIRLEDENASMQIFIQNLPFYLDQNQMDKAKIRLDLSTFITKQTKQKIYEHWANFERNEEVESTHAESTF